MQRGGPGIPSNGNGRLITRSDQLRQEGAVENEPAMWTPEHDYSPSEDRSVIRALRASSGVVGWEDFATTASVPPGWSVNVGPGRAVVDGTVVPWLQGSYVVYSPSAKAIPVEPAHPTLNRLDVVAIHVLDQENSTEEGFGWRREVFVGEPGSGVPPELPPNCLPLRGLSIQAGSTAVTGQSLIFFPPWWVNVDLRRPATTPLMHVFDRKQIVPIPTVTVEDPHYFNLQIPAIWRPYALWPFQTVMEVAYEMYVWSNAAGLINSPTLTYFPRGRDRQSEPGGSPIYASASLAVAQGITATTTSLHDLQLFDAFEPPQMNVTVVAQAGAVSLRLTYDLKIWPRLAGTHKILDEPQW